MADPQLGTVVRQVRRILSRQPPDDCTDRHLVELFSATRQEAAFAALVRRHQAMVMSVCRRVLDDWHDAEDAFQATFLVLAKKVGTVRKHESIASWLYGVAYRVALKARARSSRRKIHERRVCENDVRSSPEAAWDELKPILDTELTRLPERYRAPLVLCYLEGKTRDEAAHQLGWTPGMVKGYLERGRGLLRKRLAQRGLTLSAALLVAGMTHAPAYAAVALLASTIKAATAIAAGQTAATAGVSATVVALTKGAYLSMLPPKVMLTANLALCLGCAVVGLYRYSSLLDAPEQPAAIVVDDEKEKPAKDEPKKEEPKKSNSPLARQKSMNNLKIIGIAMHNHAVQNTKPPGGFPAHAIYSKDGKPLLSWRVAILPYIDHDNLYKQFKLDEPWDSAHNKKLLAQIPNVYNPLGGVTKEPHSTFYQVVAGKGTVFEGKEGKAINRLLDGTSSTLLVAESAEAVPWTKPEDIVFVPDQPLPKFGGMFEGGFHILMADGSVRHVKEKFNADMMRRIITCADGEVTDLKKLNP